MVPGSFGRGLCRGFVLTGGNSSRMGQDKALMEIGGRALCLHVAEAVRRAVGSVTLVGNGEKYAALGVPVIDDVIKGRGPLSGVHAVLKNTKAPLNLVVGCDMPFVTPEFLAFLVGVAAVADAEVTVVESAEFGYESLCAVYGRQTLPKVEAALESPDHQLKRLYEQLHVRRLSPEEWAPFNAQGHLFTNVNTPQDFDAVRKKVDLFSRANAGAP